MVLEYCQLLSTCHSVTNPDNYVVTGEKRERIATLYGQQVCRPSHVNHPCALWLRESDSNYDWLHTLACCLSDEYTKRYKRRHCNDAMLRGPLAVVPGALPVGSLTEHVQCMPEVYRQPCDPVLGYRLFYIGCKMHFARWRHSSRPTWVDAAYEKFDSMELPYGAKSTKSGRERRWLSVLENT